MMTKHRALFITRTLIFIGFVLAPRPPNEYNESKEDVATPDAFWPVTQSAHGSGGNGSTIYAILHGASLLDDAPVTGLKSIQFTGASDSYVDIQHDGLLNGTRAMCWLFYIKPDIAKDGIILEYLVDNSGTGFQIWQKSTFIEVKVFDISGSLVNFYSSDILVIGTWKFVGVNYNFFWGDVDIFVVTAGTPSNSVFADKISVTPDSMTLLVNAHGTVRIGAPSLATGPEDGFKGKISCIQFYTTSLLGRTQKSTLDLCDPASWGGMPIDRTMNYVAQPTQPTTFQFTETAFREETCLRFKLMSPNATFANSHDVIGDVLVTSVGECVKVCASHPACVSVSVAERDSNVLNCTLSNSETAALEFSQHHKIYTLK